LFKTGTPNNKCTLRPWQWVPKLINKCLLVKPRGEFNGTACVGGEPTCHGDAVLEGEDCVAPVDPKCDTGFKFKGNKCVAEKAPSCPPLSTYDPSTQECIVDKGPECPSEQVLRAGHLLAAVRSLHGFRVLSVSGAVPVHQANYRTGCALIGSCLLMV
jgi:hypothetical protein